MSITPNQRYQEGSVQRVARVKGPDVWVFRWRELQPDGRRIQRKRIVGDVERFPNKGSIKREVETLRAEINAAQDRISKMTIGELWAHFEAHELCCAHADRSPTTIEGYRDNYRRYILPRWGDTEIDQVKAVAVERWLSSLPYAPSTKPKLRNQLSCLYSHAIRHELWDKNNPIAAVRQSSKRLRTPDFLTLPEMQAIVAGLKDPMHRVIVLIAAVTGLRRSEIRGLKWGDVDFDKLWLNLQRGVVKNMQTKLKTEASRRGIPITLDLSNALLDWRRQCLYRADDDWILASPAVSGRAPIWLDLVLRNYVRPVAKAAGIIKEIGWHTFRRSLATLLASKGEKIKVVQELLRHSNASITMELYQQAEAELKRNAQGHVADLFLMPKAS